MSLQEIYNLMTEPRYLLSANYFTILGDTAVMVFPPVPMNSEELIYIEYQSVGHDGAFAFRDSIKAVDATVQVGYSVWPNDQLLSQNFFRNDFVQSPPDFIIAHTYPNTEDIESLANSNYFSEIPYLPQQLVQYVIRGQEMIDSVSLAWSLPQRLGIAITEWSFANAECKECNMDRFDGIIGAINTTMFAASYMEAMHNSSINLVALNFHPLVKKWGLLSLYDITPGSLNLVITSRAHAMRMLNNTIGTKFFTINSADITGNPMIDILTKNPNGSIDTIAIPALKIWGGIDSLYHNYSLLLINQDDSLDHSVTFHVPTEWSVDSVFVEKMTGIPDDSIYNLSKETLPIVNDSVQITLPAFSLTALRFQGPTTGVENTPLATSYSLENAYPNPFNPTTTISYQIPQAGNVTLKIYDILGREIATLVDEYKQPGIYNTQFSILNSELTSGIYFYQLKSGSFIQTKKMLVLK
ncbi:MAG: T9SS type A sorting domain-containing protein [Bacteroidetes bacterium]|nr:T9SS type A sorting domain-containing protein [Bacteroidota bacterium]MBU2507205.1 T9SS type A sorting domain-containing protein [Bacteroidota bacterium]